MLAVAFIHACCFQPHSKLVGREIPRKHSTGQLKSKLGPLLCSDPWYRGADVTVHHLQAEQC